MPRKVFFGMVLALWEIIALFSMSTVQSVDSTPTIRLSPGVILMKSVGSTFVVDIVVDNVTDFWGWQASVRWNPKVIQITAGDPNGIQGPGSTYFDVYEGPFMKNQAPTVFGINALDNSLGMIWLWDLFKSLGHGVNGGGVVATVNFTVLDFGFTALEIFDSVLADKFNHLIQHNAENGSVRVFTVCVDDDNASGPWDGSLEHPYQNITSALSNTSDNDTVFVREGIYYGNFTIDKAITLVGENNTTTIVDGGRAGTPVTVVADFANITRLTIRNGYSVPHVTFGVEVLNCHHVAIRGSIISDNDVGIFLYHANESTITGNWIFNNWRGMIITFSRFNYVSNNSIFDNEECGISMESDACNNKICENEIYNSSFAGIGIGWSSENYVASNNLTRNNEAGLRLDAANNNTIVGNQIAFNSRDGIAMYGSNSNTIKANEFTDNSWDGISVGYSNSNIIYHNNFLNNTGQARSDSESHNFWDDGYPSGGNFWTDFVAVDFCSGPYQNDSQSDGVCDTRYIIDGSDSDRYPLVDPFKTFSVLSDETMYHVEVVSNATTSGLSFDKAARTLMLNVTGQSDTAGHCRITLPRSLMQPGVEERWASRIDSYLPLSTNIMQDADNTYFYLTYEQSVHSISIRIINGSEAVIHFYPEVITVEKNETFSVNFVTDNIPFDNGMAGIEFKVMWNPSFLNSLNMTEVVFHTVTPHEEQDNIWRLASDVTPSYVSYAYCWYDMNRAVSNGYAPISGNLTVATITLEATATGSVTLHIATIKIGSREGDHLVDVAPSCSDPRGSLLNYYLVDCRIKIKTTKADLNEDGSVDLFDALTLAQSFGDVLNKENWNPDKDLNNDQTIDIFDMILLANKFGETFS